MSASHNRLKTYHFTVTPSFLFPILLGCFFPILLPNTVWAQEAWCRNTAAVKQRVVRSLQEPSSDNSPNLKALVECGSDGIQPLFELLNDPDLQIRMRAIIFLTNIGKDNKKDVISVLRQALKSGYSDVRQGAINALGDVKTDAKALLPDLQMLLKDSDVSLRQSAMSALETIKTKDAVPALRQALHDNDPKIRSSAAQSLGEIGADATAAMSELQVLFGDSNKDVHQSAMSASTKIGAKDTVPALRKALKESNAEVRADAAESLGEIGADAIPALPDLQALLNDSIVEVRRSAIQAFGKIGAKDAVPVLRQALQDKDAGVRDNAVTALGNIGVDAKVAIPDLKALIRENPAEAEKCGRDWQHSGWGTSSCNSEVAAALRNISSDLQKQRKQLSGSELDQAIHNLEDALKKLEQAKDKENINQQISDSQVFLTILKEEQRSRRPTAIVKYLSLSCLAHVSFWLILIYFYPKSSQVQAIFFWNPWVRKIAGLGYVNALLVTVPFLQRRLFAPFQKDLRQAAGLDQFDPTAYFQESRVKRSLWSTGKETEEILPLTTAIPNLKGQMLLQAPSGFGKTMFLRHLINQSPQRTTVFLTATECAQAKDQDVIQAIQAKLPIAASDPNFLKSLIYKGAIDICIDGLNEINAEAQASIKQFLSSYTRGNIILTTQPLSDKNPPQSAQLYRLLPLNDEQIFHFLTSRHPSDTILQGADYQQSCDAYLKEVLNPDQLTEDLIAVRRVLSNPMDLNTVAEMLANKERPELFRLQHQLYDRMATNYADHNNGFPFPLKPIAQLAYDMRLSDQNLLPKDKLSQDVIDILEQHKLLTPKSGSWQFRHDKIWDFFIIQKFLEDPEKAYQELKEPEKMKDTRLRGVYLQLATELDWAIAQALEKALFDYASSTGDHTASDPFRRHLESRRK